MKGVKLKALYLSEKDILVSPPQFLNISNKPKHTMSQTMTQV